MEIAREEAGGGPRPVRVDALNPATAAAWRAIRRMPEGLVLYGGTAVALYLGHRESRDRYANSSMIRRPSSNRRGRRSKNGMFGGFRTGNQCWLGHRDVGKYRRWDIPALYEELGNGDGSVKDCFVGEFVELAKRDIPIIDELQGPGGGGGHGPPVEWSRLGSPSGKTLKAAPNRPDTRGGGCPREVRNTSAPAFTSVRRAPANHTRGSGNPGGAGGGQRASGRRSREPTKGSPGKPGGPARQPAPGAEGFDIVPRLIDAPGDGIFPRYRCGSELPSPRRRAFADTSPRRLRRGAPWRRPPPRPCLARRWTAFGVDFASPRC